MTMTLQLRGRVRSRLCWIDGGNGDALALGMRKWKVKELDWDGWRKFLVAVQTCKWDVASQIVIFLS